MNCWDVLGCYLKHQSRAISCFCNFVRPPCFTDFGSETIGGDRYNLSNHVEFCLQVHKLVRAPRPSSDRASERASRRSVLPCLGGARTCSTVLSSPQQPHRRPEGLIDMALVKYKIFEKPRFVARMLRKVEMGAQHPISTPHQRCIAPPNHAPSTPPTINENCHNVS